MVTQQQLQTLHEVCGFRWNDIAETLGVSDRTLRRRRHEFGMRVDGREFSLLSDAELDDIVRNIRAVTPKAGLLMVQGSLRQQGLMVQRVCVMHLLRRVDPVTSEVKKCKKNNPKKLQCSLSKFIVVSESSILCVPGVGNR